MITLLVQPEQLESELCIVEGNSYRHLFRARRVAAGTRLRLVDGRGNAFWAIVQGVDRHQARLEIEEKAPTHEPSYRLSLIVAALRAERASWLVEKCTELGAHSISFISTQRTPRRYGAANLERLRRVASAALAQSHRAWLPQIRGVETWSETIARLAAEPEATDRILLDRQAGLSSRLPARPLRPHGSALIGPEGGWDPRELEELAQLGYQAISLGERTLRVETAAVAIMARLLSGSG